MLREEESYREMKYVEQICKDWAIPFEGTRVNVTEVMKHRKESTEVVAREVRYDFFKTVMEKRKITHLALAHHGDDQVETILMRLTRGAELQAIAGIRAKRPFAHGTIIRPFLAVSKDEIESYIHYYQLEPVYDATNKLDIYTRNRFRNHILPFLKKENNNVHDHFQRFSEQLIEDENYLMGLAKDVYNRLIKEEDAGLSVSIPEFLKEPASLQKRCLHLLTSRLYNGELPPNLSSIHTNAVIELMKSPKPSGKLDLPKGLEVVRSYQMCHFTFNKRKPEKFCYEWHWNETITLPNGNQLRIKKVDQLLPKGNHYFILQPNIQFPLYVRSRKDGDRIHVKGLNGSKKVKSIFIENKIPKYERDEWPIITDATGTILWIPLLRKSKYEGQLNEYESNFILEFVEKENN